ACVRNALLVQRQQRGQRAEDRVAIVGAAAAVQLVALEHRRPRTEAVGPAGSAPNFPSASPRHPCTRGWPNPCRTSATCWEYECIPPVAARFRRPTNRRRNGTGGWYPWSTLRLANNRPL